MDPYGTKDERRSHVYRSYVRAYRDAQALYDYMYERWRNEVSLYLSIESVSQDSKYGVIMVNG